MTPRVFLMDDFLTATECRDIMELAQSQGLVSSMVTAGSAHHERDSNTRSPSNVWLTNDAMTMNVKNVIYERAARILNISESLLHAPKDDDVHA